MNTHALAVCEYDRLITFSQDHMISGWRVRISVNDLFCDELKTKMQKLSSEFCEY